MRNKALLPAENRYSTAAILAGGRSRRMGYDKFKLNINEQPLLDQTAAVLRQVFDHILIVANTDEIGLPAGARLVHDQYPGMGPLAGIHAALKAADSQYVFVIACDMPNLSLDLIQKQRTMLDARPASVCCCTMDGAFEPFQAFYSTQLVPILEQQLRQGNLKVQDLLGRLEIIAIDSKEFAGAKDLFANLNTPDELAEFLES